MSQLIIIIIGNILSGIGMLLLAVSVYQKTKKNMLKFQILDTLFTAAACGVLGGYSGMTTDLIAMYRNILNFHNEGKEIKESVKKAECFIIVFLLISIGLLSNNKGLIGLLPIIACVEYTIAMFVVKNYTILKLSLALNTFLWCVYSIIIKDYIGFIIKVIMVINTLVAIVVTNKTSEKTKEQVLEKEEK